MSVRIVIPARMKATRLPNKPLALVDGVPMIVQVWRRAMESGLGEVIVACDGEEIAQVIRAAGGVAVITDPDLPSGSDRIWQALQRADGFVPPPLRGRLGGGSVELGAVSINTPSPQPSDYKNQWLSTDFSRSEPARGEGAVVDDIIINLQGDVPTLEPRLLAELLKPLADPAVDIATLAAPIARAEEHENSAVVKIVMAQTGRALYFTRAAAPWGEGSRYHHIGVYAYRRAALERFVALPPSPLELREKLEQLRALEAGMRIDVAVVDTVPLGVDTPEDLVRANDVMMSMSS